MNIKGFFAIALVTLLSVVNGEAAVQEVDTIARELQVVNFSSKLTNAINMKRAEKGLKAVCMNSKLMKAAQIQANDMAKNSFVNTRGSDGSIPTVRYKKQGFTPTRSAEMVGAGYVSVDAVVAAWIKSAGAYLYSDLKFIGTGYKYDSTKLYKHYWVLDMANANGEVCG
ncbi:hypothetical protein PHMEG_00023528 [Phytophthora megakarya]|uniref:SCP domain-containing protein n=1 Tax=Phytophthora megakarya TaxID=4795 RepID=A0A225VGV4_9STRA|nr:hypothetical protein PHMEG_00023528 [Phytophthora megakarya]